MGLAHIFLRWLTQTGRFVFLLSELTSWAAAAPFFRRGARHGEVTRHILLYGLGALPIVGVIMFLIGSISAIQSADQLKVFGANIFVADLLAVGITAEMGPLMAAIIMAGRSGSAIAAEIATMRFTEEFEALETMGLNPLRFVMVPKLWAMVISMPVITLFADALGILGGTLIAVTYLDLNFVTFWHQLLKALSLRHIISGAVKSVTYAWLITAVGCHQGVSFQGGAAAVGRATTAAVVQGIFSIIAADAALGLLFYF